VEVVFGPAAKATRPSAADAPRLKQVAKRRD